MGDEKHTYIQFATMTIMMMVMMMVMVIVMLVVNMTLTMTTTMRTMIVFGGHRDDDNGHNDHNTNGHNACMSSERMSLRCTFSA